MVGLDGYVERPGFKNVLTAPTFFEDTPIEELESEILRRFMPRTRFYKTVVHLHEIGGGDSVVIVAVTSRSKSAEPDRRLCCDLFFGGPSTNFRDLFRNIDIDDPALRKQFAESIASLLVAATPKTRIIKSEAVRREDGSGWDYRIGLWSDRWYPNPAKYLLTVIVTVQAEWKVVHGVVRRFFRQFDQL